MISCRRAVFRCSYAPVDVTHCKFSTFQGHRYSLLTDRDIHSFEGIVGSASLIGSAKGHDLSAYNTDWQGQFSGKSSLVLKPKSTDETREIIKYCQSRKLALCIQGGNTSLTGGSVPVNDEIILSLSKMNKIIDFDSYSGILTCEAGCILEAIDSALAEHGFTVPVDLGAKGSCHIGGNLSTAAGGVRFVRYGSLHSSLIGVEVVGPGGFQKEELAWTIDLTNNVRKDNMGPHLSHLFVGSEGQFGVITRLRLLCPPKPTSQNVALIGTNSFASCLNILRHSKRMLGEILSSFELMDRQSVQCVKDNLGLNVPFDTNKVHNFYILLETLGSNSEHDRSKLENFLDYCLKEKLVENGCLAEDKQQESEIWRFRESVTLALRADGYVYRMDLSLPTEKFYEVVELARHISAPLAHRTVGFGHLADGNVHLNVTSERHSADMDERIVPYIYQWTCQNGGSISAEHGVGQSKRKYLHLAKPKHFIDRCVDLKRLFDPDWILNPYKCFPD